MEVATPPKRITRARAAAKASTSTSSDLKAVKSAKAATAASAKKTTTTARTTSHKRKLRSDDSEIDEESQHSAEDSNAETMNQPPHRTRGRPKKAAEATAHAQAEADSSAPTEEEHPKRARTTRTRATKKTATEASKAEPAKPARTRTRKAHHSEEDDEEDILAEAAPVKKTARTRKTQAHTEKETEDKAAEPAKKKTTRTRARTTAAKTGTICTTVGTNPTPGLKSAVSRPASRVGAVKKSVTFQEPEKENPEKENIVPATSAKGKAKAGTATGMRAKPVRKPATRTARTTARSHTTASSSKRTKPVPLSPKKDAPNRPLSRDSNSDDELAGSDDMPRKPLQKTTIKPRTSHKMLDLAPPSKEEEHEEEDDDDEEKDEATVTVASSAARRPPASPWKDSMRSPAKRIEALPSLMLSSTEGTEPTQSPLKTSMLRSPAKRPLVPIKSLQMPSNDQSDLSKSPLRRTLFQSPAKRPASPLKLGSSKLQSSKNDAVAFPSIKSPAKEQETEARQSEDQGVPDTSELIEVVHEPEVEETEALEAIEVIEATQQVEETEEEEDDDDEAQESVETQELERIETIEDVAQPTTIADEPMEDDAEPDEIHMTQEDQESDHEDAVLASESPQLEFNGRLSTVLPRHADPAIQEHPVPVPPADVKDETPEPVEAHSDTVEPEPAPESQSSATNVPEDDMEVDEITAEQVTIASPPHSVRRSLNPMFNRLRQKDVASYESEDSEDELASSDKLDSKFQDDSTMNLSAVPPTPTPAAVRTPRSGLPPSAIKAADRAIRSVSGSSKLGFTPLARQFSDWKASTPLKLGDVDSPMVNGNDSEEEDISLIANDVSPVAEPSPAKRTFFDDEITVMSEMEAALEADIAVSFEGPGFDDIPVTDEDMQLAAEAHEMSLLEPQQVEQMMQDQVQDDSISETSQEYGDENAVPVDPALVGRQSLSAPPVTPRRPIATRTFHTTTKVPLKPADDSTPPTVRKRSASVSRLPPKRPNGLTRSATVISYSPTKSSAKSVKTEEVDEIDDQSPVTPSKSDMWSSMGTPARTPRRDLNPSLLRGAVVFVDVHTSEGADASSIFVELLTQMGARCVKSWPWNPNSSQNGESSTSKVGITHVVFKDGGKRTMEKVRQSGGVVQCVGVGWVLDCERENQWLDEAPYYIDTSLIPRGGHRRRKSMEPKALANMNGTLVTSSKPTTASREVQSVPNGRRRDSSVWMRTPSERDDEDEIMTDVGDEDDWDAMGVLTPVPKTPAPEAIHRFAMNVEPETPTANRDDTQSSGMTEERERLLMRTAPPKQQSQSIFANLGQGVLGEEKDQNVLMRLMAARRKSLQFAPKVASPLRRNWD